MMEMAVEASHLLQPSHLGSKDGLATLFVLFCCVEEDHSLRFNAIFSRRWQIQTLSSCDKHTSDGKGLQRAGLGNGRSATYRTWLSLDSQLRLALWTSR